MSNKTGAKETAVKEGNHSEAEDLVVLEEENRSSEIATSKAESNDSVMSFSKERFEALTDKLDSLSDMEETFNIAAEIFSWKENLDVEFKGILVGSKMMKATRDDDEDYLGLIFMDEGRRTYIMADAMIISNLKGQPDGSAWVIRAKSVKKSSNGEYVDLEIVPLV